MNKRERAKFEKQLAASSAVRKAEHAALRRLILARRPAWNVALLECIQQTYGFVSEDGPAAGLPGLHILLQSIEEQDAIASRFNP
jgi:hypothetical protein